jgi:hypothetical protein
MIPQNQSQFNPPSLEQRARAFPSFQETEDFFKNPSEFLKTEDAETIMKHSSISKRFCSNPHFDSLNQNRALHKQNSILIMAPGYELLNIQEKEFCELGNILPSDYQKIKIKVAREQAKLVPITTDVIKEKLL